LLDRLPCIIIEQDACVETMRMPSYRSSGSQRFARPLSAATEDGSSRVSATGSLFSIGFPATARESSARPGAGRHICARLCRAPCALSYPAFRCPRNARALIRQALVGQPGSDGQLGTLSQTGAGRLRGSLEGLNAVVTGRPLAAMGAYAVDICGARLALQPSRVSME